VYAPIGVRPLQVARHLHFEDFTKDRKTTDVVIRNFTPHPRPSPPQAERGEVHNGTTVNEEITIISFPHVIARSF